MSKHTGTLVSLAKSAGAIAVLATVISSLAKQHFVLDILSNFRMHYSVALVLCTALLAYRRGYLWCLLFGVGAAVNVASVAPWYASPAGTVPGTDPVRILVANVFMGNTEYHRLAQLARTEQPDVLGLLEVNAQWLASLESVKQSYPYRHEVPHDDFFGLALYSRLPISESNVVHFGAESTPALVATIVASNSEFELILTHLVPPMSRMRAKLRNDQLGEMARYIRASGKQVVVAGDLNTTMWSPYYVDFADVARLDNARAGYGIGPTWPPFPGLGVPIDHVMATSTIELDNFRVLAGIGSDHLPVSADIRLQPGRYAHRVSVARHQQ